MKRSQLCVFHPGSGESGCVFFLLLLLVDREPLLRLVPYLCSLCFEPGRDYTSLSSIGMVLAVEVGLRDGMDSMSVFIIHPS